VERPRTRDVCTPGGRLDREDTVSRAPLGSCGARDHGALSIQTARGAAGPDRGRRPPGLCDRRGLCVENSAISGDAFVLPVLPRSVKDVTNHQAFGRRMDREESTKTSATHLTAFVFVLSSRSIPRRSPGHRAPHLCLTPWSRCSLCETSPLRPPVTDNTVSPLLCVLCVSLIANGHPEIAITRIRRLASMRSSFA
jgi:hypothetical protein